MDLLSHPHHCRLCISPRRLPLACQVDVDSVFAAVSDAKARLGLRAWGLAHTTLEDVFISISSQSDAPPSSQPVTAETPENSSSS